MGVGILENHKLFTNWWTMIGNQLKEDRGYQSVMDWIKDLADQDVIFDENGIIEITDIQKGKSSTAFLWYFVPVPNAIIFTKALDYIFNELDIDVVEFNVPITKLETQKIYRGDYLNTNNIVIKKEEVKEDGQHKQISENGRIPESNSSSGVQLQPKRRKLKLKSANTHPNARSRKPKTSTNGTTASSPTTITEPVLTL